MFVFSPNEFLWSPTAQSPSNLILQLPSCSSSFNERQPSWLIFLLRVGGIEMLLLRQRVFNRRSLRSESLRALAEWWESGSMKTFCRHNKKHFHSIERAGEMSVLWNYSCDYAHHVIYDDFSASPSKNKGTNAPYLGKKGRKWDTLLIKASLFEIETFALVLLPFLTIRWWSGEPEQEYLDVRTSRLVNTSGPTCTNGQQRKNCLKPRRNLKRRRRGKVILMRRFKNVERRRHKATPSCRHNNELLFSFHVDKHQVGNVTAWKEEKEEGKPDGHVCKFTKLGGWPNENLWTSINYDRFSFRLCIIYLTFFVDRRMNVEMNQWAPAEKKNRPGSSPSNNKRHKITIKFIAFGYADVGCRLRTKSYS